MMPTQPADLSRIEAEARALRARYVRDLVSRLVARLSRRPVPAGHTA